MTRASPLLAAGPRVLTHTHTLMMGPGKKRQPSLGQVTCPPGPARGQGVGLLLFACLPLRGTRRCRTPPPSPPHADPPQWVALPRCPCLNRAKTSVKSTQKNRCGRDVVALVCGAGGAAATRSVDTSHVPQDRRPACSSAGGRTTGRVIRAPVHARRRLQAYARLRGHVRARHQVMGRDVGSACSCFRQPQ